MKTAMPYLSFFVLLYLGACAYLYANQRSFLYFPTPEVSSAAAEVILLKSDGETLRIWHAGPESAHAVIYFGGNSEDVSTDIPLLLQALPNQSIYLVNYRGYGGSTGVPTEAGLFKDAIAVFDAVHAKHANISVVGRSLGSGVAIYLATVRNVKKQVLVTPYDSIENVAKKQFPLFPVSLLLKDKFESTPRARVTTTPTLVILSEKDDIVPRANSNALIAAFPLSIAKVEVVAGATHNSIGASEDYWRHLREFLQ
jgi:fermentation-respiration switch protein FrsA (DUF1100 family)